MKTIVSFAALAAVLTGTGYAQMNPLPPPSSTDGVFIQSIGANAGTGHWDNPSGIASFKMVSTTDGAAPLTSSTYNPQGVPFAATMPAALQTRLATLNTKGGIIRTIFLGESAGWLDSFGYTYSGAFNGPDAYTAFAKTEANPAATSPVNVNFGDYFDINLAAGAATTFDFWFQGEDMTSGGDYTLLHPANSVPPSNGAMWAQRPLVANTWNTTLNSYVDISTYVVGLEDWLGGDKDFTDGMYAFQFYTPTGAPDIVPVPEPATYGLIGVAALLGLIALRRVSR